jgi:DNA-binding LacI/PurR family transcriptional regulator
VATRRIAGYRQAVADAGLDPDGIPIIDGFAYDRAATAAAVRRLFTTRDRPTGVLAMSDEMAVAVLEAARSVGLQVPGDLSVVGFDDTVSAETSTPTLTTVHQPHADKGATAVRMLLAGPAGKDVTFPTHLVVRESTAPPPT